MKKALQKVLTVIAIDPDVDKNGVATLNTETRRIDTGTLNFADTLGYLRMKQREAEVTGKPFRVIIEAGWLNKSHWHLTAKDSKQSAAAKGNAAGRNHEVGRKLAEMCDHWQIPYELIKPLPLRAGSVYFWSGKDGKITAAELEAVTGIKHRTNQEARDAALIAWTWAGFPVKLSLK